MIQRMGSLDLAVAHMVCNLGGRVQLQAGLAPPGHWHQRYNGAPADLPNTYSGHLKLEAIDLSGTPVMYEGLKMLRESPLCLICIILDGRSSSLSCDRTPEAPRWWGYVFII